MAINRILRGVSRFQREVYPEQRELFERLALGQRPRVEYAVGVLGVEDVIVCGHTDCGVMKGVLNPEAVGDLPAVSAWLDYAQQARD